MGMAHRVRPPEQQVMQSPAATRALAFGALLAAIGLRWLLDPLMNDAMPLVTVYGAIAVAVWAAGYRVAAAVALLGYLACDYLFISPRGSFLLADPGHQFGVIAYLVTCTLIIALGHLMRVAQQRAKTRGEVLQVTLRSIGDAVITTDKDGHVTDLNGVAESITGWTRAEAFGQPIEAVFRIVSEVSRLPLENPATRALREGAVVALANHTVLLRKNGDECPIDDSAAPIRDNVGNVSGCVLIFRDVAERRRVERERDSQLVAARTLAAIVESSDDAIVGKSLDGIISSWNAAAQRLFGYPADQAVGRHISLIIPPERIGEEDEIIASLTAGRSVDHFETKRLRSDGSRVDVSLTISPIRDQAGSVIGASKIARDITARKLAEAERQRFVTLIDTSTDFIGMCDLNAVPFFVNRSGLAMVGLDTLEQARRTSVWDFFFPEDVARIKDEFFPSVLEHGHGETEVRFRHFKSGEARWMAYKVVMLRDPTGRPAAFATVSQDVSENKRLTDDLRRLAAELSAADRRKNEFLATLAHELRNPLAPISSMLEVLKHPNADESLVRRARDTLGRQLKQLIRLVDDLMDLNRVTLNRLDLRASQVELSAVLHQALEASRPLVDSAGHQLQVSLPAKAVYLRADGARLAQVFGNLINNSCKYTPAGGAIRVSAELDRSEVAVTIEDTGIGIPPGKLQDIFEMFNQVEQSSVRSQGGLGIGLTLAKRLVELHSGSIEARSDGEGQGSQFIVRLPVIEPAQSLEPGAPVPGTTCVHRRVLVVDDNVDAGESLATLVSMWGNEILLATDGRDAIEIAERHRPEVVILDLGLPGLNGYEVCAEIRSRDWGKNLKVFALSGWGQEEDRRRSEEAGFDGHLVKPVDSDTLRELLTSETGAVASRSADELFGTQTDD
jgi:PAS domain S-box-containing protein